MASKREKLAVAILALIFVVAAVGLISVGSFLPYWAVVKNSTVQGNVSFSLWTRRECFGLVCTTEYVTKQWVLEECIKGKCKRVNGSDVVPVRECRVANFCNSTWVTGTDLENTPSMLIAAQAFETPSVFFALVCLGLYVIKIALLVKRPDIKRSHLKAAYLTFGAIAGVVAIVGVILFCTMLEGDKYDRKWAPYLNLAGGIIFFLFGFGGYLRWRDRTVDHEFEDDTSLCEANLHEIRETDPAYHKQTSQTSPKAAEACL